MLVELNSFLRNEFKNLIKFRKEREKIKII